MAIAFGIGAWLRLDQVLAQVLIEDEWHPVHQVLYYGPLHVLRSFGSADYSIPLVLLYFAEHRLWGLSELGLRWPMLLAGIATVLVLPLLVRRRVDAVTLGMFTLLLALSPFLVSYSRIGRSYAVTLLGIYLAFACLERAIRDGPVAWRFVAGYAVLCGLVVWAHAVTGPMLVAPLAWLSSQTLRGKGLRWRTLLGIGAVTGACMALAVLPPLLGDPAALAGKSGMDRPNVDTVIGAWHLWTGTGSAVVAGWALFFAILGLPRVWRAATPVRWVLLGTALTVAALLVSKPWWVDRPLALARYLLPVVPVVLLSVASGIALVGSGIARRFPGTPWVGIVPPAFAAILVATWLPTTPTAETLRRPNSYTQHSYFQYDYRTGKNPIVLGQATYPMSPWWKTLAPLSPGSLTVAVAPFQYATYQWAAPIWEAASRQRVIPAFVWGACQKYREGEVPPGTDFPFRNAVHAVDAWDGFRQRIDYVAYYRSPEWSGMNPRMPACEAWFRERFGKPVHEDNVLIVWKNPNR